MFDLSAEKLLTSIAETISWCATQPITARLTETPNLLKRRRLIEEGKELTRRAKASGDRFWNRMLRRDYENTPEWRMGMIFIHQAQQISIAPQQQELRSIDLMPQSAIGEAKTDEEREKVVRSVVAMRSRLLRPRVELILPHIGADLSVGRLLTYVPVENVADGAAEFESNGFFDFEDAPPWDTWIAYSDSTLLSWVPTQLIPLVQRGIDVNPVGCIRWMN